MEHGAAPAVFRTGALSATVVDEHGLALTDFVLGIETFLPEESWAPLPDLQPRAVHDASGTFRWDGLPFGRYTLTVLSAGRSPGSTASVRLSSTVPHAAVTIALYPGATLAGTVVDRDDGTPVAGAMVMLDRGSFSVWEDQGAVTDRQGSFVLAPVPAGPFSVRVEALGYRSHFEGGVYADGASSRKLALRRAPDGAASESVGIGAVVGKLDDASVLFVITGSPAERAGLRSLDRVTRIEGQATDGLTQVECMELLGGSAGTPVTLAVERADQPGAITEVGVVREIVEL